MGKTRAFAFVAVLGALLLAGCIGERTRKVPPCCAQAQATDGWCEQCNKGFIAGSGQVTQCRGCVEASKKNGWCDACNVGYANGQKITCRGCHTAATGGAPCPVHRGSR